MKKKDIYFTVGALVVIGIFIFLSQIGRKAKPVSVIPEHAGFTSRTGAETCWTCHAPDSSVKPMPERHPKRGRPPDKSSCFVCHTLPNAAILIPNSTLYADLQAEEKFIWRNPQQK